MRSGGDACLIMCVRMPKTCARTIKKLERERERERERDRRRPPPKAALGRGSGADGMGADCSPEQADFWLFFAFH